MPDSERLTGDVTDDDGAPEQWKQISQAQIVVISEFTKIVINRFK